MLLEHTIAALATPPGTGGIAVVRISGEESYKITNRIFKPKNNNRAIEKARGYTAMLGDVCAEGESIDEAIALFFRAPHSYTGEDVVELSCHGGEAVSARVLRACYDAGASPAGAGEFTKRALLNGRISLTQAEAVMELIQASSHRAAGFARANLQGALAEQMYKAQEKLVTLAGHIAAYTDYPEEDVPELSMQTLEASLEQVKRQLDTLLAGYDAGAVLRRGVSTAIVGSPNVGKSTLLNLLAGFDKAIVTPIAGTTRDVVEQEIQLGELRLLLADTAGLRETQDVVEAEGIRRSYRYLERADLVLAVFDASLPITDADLELARRCAEKPALALMNKTDLAVCAQAQQLTPYFSQMLFISATDAAFLPEIERAVAHILKTDTLEPNAALLANERQRTAVQRASLALGDALAAVADGYTLDAAGVCIEDALRALYELTGENVADDIVEEVFSKFCVGK